MAVIRRQRTDAEKQAAAPITIYMGDEALEFTPPTWGAFVRGAEKASDLDVRKADMRVVDYTGDMAHIALELIGISDQSERAALIDSASPDEIKALIVTVFNHPTKAAPTPASGQTDQAQATE